MYFVDAKIKNRIKEMKEMFLFMAQCFFLGGMKKTLFNFFNLSSLKNRKQKTLLPYYFQ